MYMMFEWYADDISGKFELLHSKDVVKTAI